MATDNLRISADNTNYKAIACEQIPELFLDKMVAKNHFSKFGKIKRFILRPMRLSCTIEYENEDDAKNACLNSGNFNGFDFIVTYAEHEVAHVQNTEEWVNPEVQAELDAMSPGHRFDATLRHSNRIAKNADNFTTFSPRSSRAICKSKQNSPQPESSKIDSAVRQEIESLLKTPAFTDEEKYRVLDARDKLIRLTTVRQTDIKKAKATQGTCPDMCPEKERLMREFQRQVSIFETAEEEASESKISHKKAIKEYSRSSADQEVPLSHELRSESVLQMTMLYLVHRIMGLCDDPKTSLCDWFHFVWDRTRSIRKDITQQELCSLGAVQLVEQCARFHIHCAARLVAEDPSVFDKKINAENLTKCLQTLKYMYHDLRIKGVQCPCEAEFRSYIILLNLGDSNFLWEIKQLPELIQKSVEIKRAIAFYNALQNNNFVRFFSMIKMPETTYLSACILLGYFVRLRVRAMDAIIKSHNWRKNDVHLPLSYLTSILGFDDENSAVNFFNHYGLHCDIVEKRVLLDRLIKPSIEYAMDRALRLVESKLQISVGACIFGQKLPPTTLFEHHQPHNSFDNKGMLKIASLPIDFHIVSSDAKADTKLHQEKPDKSSVSNEINLFKIPKTLSVISPNLQTSQHIQQEQKMVKEAKKNVTDSFIMKTGEKDHSSAELKCYDNISSASSSTNESLFKTPSSNMNSKRISNTPNKSATTLGNIFSAIPRVQSKSENIFTSAVRENVNIFQQQNNLSENLFGNGNVFQELRTSAANSLFSRVPSDTASTVSEQQIEQNNISTINMDHGNILDLKTEANRIKEEENLKNSKQKNLRGKRNKEEDADDGHEREINKLKSMLEEKSKNITELFLLHIIEKELLQLAQTELASQNIMEASDREKNHLIIDVVKVCVEDIVHEEYALMCYDQLLLRRYFSRWLIHLRKKKEQWKLIESTPLWITTSTRAEYAQSIKHPCEKTNMEMIKRYRFGQSCDLSNFFEEKCDEIPLNLFALVGQHLLPKRNFSSCGLLQQRVYFKFLITLPGNKEELLGFESFSNKLLFKLIKKCQTEAGPFVHGIEQNVALCVRKLNGIIPKNEQGNVMTVEGDHNDGVICFITGVRIDTHSRKRIYTLLKLSKNLKRIPLAIIAYSCSYNENELAELLGLDILQEECLIHSYLILGCQIKRSNFSFRKLFITAVDFITKKSYSLNCNDIEALAMQNILPFLENSLGDEMWQRWSGSSRRNPVFNKVFCLPEHVLGIYHKALDHLVHITQEDFDDMPEFPEELKVFVPENLYSNVSLGLEFFPKNWKDKAGKSLIKSFLQTLYLPNINGTVPADVEELKLWLLKYTSECIKDDDIAAAKASQEAITHFVNQIKHQFQNFEISSSAHMTNYLNVFKPIIFSHINRMLKQFEKRIASLQVIYLKDDLKNYLTQPWWLNYKPLNLVTTDYSEIPSSFPPIAPRNENNQSCVLADGINKIIAEAEEASRKAEECILAFKRKKQNSFINSSLTSHFKRTLNDSIYQFELSKKIGQYDTSFVRDLTLDIDSTVSRVLNHSSLLTQKRKMSPSKSCDESSENENIIAKATKLIHNIESMNHKKIKMKIQ